LNQRYFAIITLNQIVLTSSQEIDTDTANHLLKVYFAYFQKRMGKYQDMQAKNKKKIKESKRKKLSKLDEDVQAEETKHIAGVLTGIHRAFPFANVNDEV
jgi:ribosome biogenesis protein MAK21